MRKTPTGQRPQISQRGSAGWSWPRLKPVHEQAALASRESHSSARPSKDRLVDGNDRESYSPTTMAEKRLAEIQLPQLAATNAANSEAEGKSAVPVKPVQDRPSNEVKGRVSPISDMDTEPSDAGNNGISQLVTHNPTKDTPGAVEQPVAGFSRRGTRVSESITHLLDHNDSQLPQSLNDQSQNEGGNAVEQPYTEATVKRETPSIKTKAQSSSIQDDLSPHYETSDAVDEGSSAIQQPNGAIVTRSRTTSSKMTASESQPAINESSNDEAPVAPEDPDADVPVEEKPATPTTTPVPQVIDRVSAPSDPIPYYATPKIMVHKPSQSFQSDTSGPRTIDQVLARERRVSSSEEDLPATEKTPAAPVSSVMPRLIDTPTGAGVHKIVKVKRRSLFLRKARNAAARTTILKMTLGRQLAPSTKQALRQLANGEIVIDEPLIAS